MNFFKDLTIIITTYGNRHNFLKRTCNYWSNTDVKLIVLDSSSNSLTKKDLIKFGSNIIYYHYPNLSYLERLELGLDNVKTKYVIMHPDDDFNFKSVVHKCIQELESDNQLHVCDGVYSWFSFYKGQIFSLHKNSITIKSNSLDNDPLERLESSFNALFLYGIWRTGTLKICFARWPKKVSSPAVFCMVFQWCLAYIGKWKTLNELMWMRSYEEEPSSDRHGIKRNFYFHQWYHGESYQKEVEETIQGMVTSIAEVNNVDEKKIKSHIIHVFNKNAQLSIQEFGNSPYDFHLKFSLRKILLSQLPVSWIKMYRRLRYINSAPAGVLITTQIEWLNNQGIYVAPENINELHSLLNEYYN